MAKYRKKPIVIEAQQFHVRKHPWPTGVRARQCVDEDGCPFDGPTVIDTSEGELHVSEGDWIITGIKGERYPCKPDIFEATYERVKA
jgi:hypothetical protein